LLFPVIPRQVGEVKEPGRRDIGGCTGEKGGSGFLRRLSGRYIRVVIKSPHVGLILAKRAVQDWDDWIYPEKRLLVIPPGFFE